MREIANFDEVKEITGDYEKLPAGGYICRITSAIDVPEKEYLEIEFDISEGKYAAWFGDAYPRTGFWGGRFIRSYKEKAVGFFKAFVTAVEQSNPGYKWNWNEKTLFNKQLGIVLGYEEYVSKTGAIKERLYVAQVRAADVIKKGEYKVPELKKLKENTTPNSDIPQGFTEASNTPLPF